MTVLHSEKRRWTEVWAARGRGWQQLWKDISRRGLRSFFKYMESKGARQGEPVEFALLRRGH